MVLSNGVNKPKSQTVPDKKNKARSSLKTIDLETKTKLFEKKTDTITPAVNYSHHHHRHLIINQTRIIQFTRTSSSSPRWILSLWKHFLLPRGTPARWRQFSLAPPNTVARIWTGEGTDDLRRRSPSPVLRQTPGGSQALRSQIYSVSQNLSPLPPIFLAFFPKRLGFFCQNFTCLLYVPIYVGLQMFI